MTFEEALKAMREGKKVRRKRESDVYTVGQKDYFIMIQDCKKFSANEDKGMTEKKYGKINENGIPMIREVMPGEDESKFEKITIRKVWNELKETIESDIVEPELGYEWANDRINVVQKGFCTAKLTTKDILANDWILAE